MPLFITSDENFNQLFPDHLFINGAIRECFFLPYNSITVRLLLIDFQRPGNCRWMNGGKVDCPELKFEDENGKYDPNRE